jgi:hypothetical protein
VATAAILIVLGLGTVSRRAALPKTAMFDGQVIARWLRRVVRRVPGHEIS